MSIQASLTGQGADQGGPAATSKPHRSHDRRQEIATKAGITRLTESWRSSVGMGPRTIGAGETALPSTVLA